MIILLLAAIADLAICQGPPQVLASLELLQSEICEKEPVLARLSIENLSDAVVESAMNPSYDEEITLIVGRSDGRVSRIAYPPIAGGFRVDGRIRVEPRERWSKLLLLNDWRMDWKPGEYIVSVTWSKPIRWLVSGAPIAVQPIFPKPLRVVPYDRARLRKRLESLMLEHEASNSPIEQRRYRAAIVSVLDPVAIPFAAQVAVIDSIGLDALAAIGTHEALDVLLERWALIPPGQDEEAHRAQFRVRLQRMLSESNDSEIQRRIKAALQQ